MARLHVARAQSRKSDPPIHIYIPAKMKSPPRHLGVLAQLLDLKQLGAKESVEGNPKLAHFVNAWHGNSILLISTIVWLGVVVTARIMEQLRAHQGILALQRVDARSKRDLTLGPPGRTHGRGARALLDLVHCWVLQPLRLRLRLRVRVRLRVRFRL
jgi:hypothetical protein